MEKKTISQLDSCKFVKYHDAFLKRLSSREPKQNIRQASLDLGILYIICTIMFRYFISKCCETERVITLAGVGALCVKAVLIFFTWRRIAGALIYLCNNTTDFNSLSILCVFYHIRLTGTQTQHCQ